MTLDDMELLKQFEPLAERISEKLAGQVDGSVFRAMALEKEMYHQFLHWLDAHRDQFSDEARQELDAMPRPPEHLMFPPHPELGIPFGLDE